MQAYVQKELTLAKLPPAPRAAVLQVLAFPENDDREVANTFVLYCTYSSLWRLAQTTVKRQNTLTQIVWAESIMAWTV